jgi:signal transduction histidine kinase
MKLPLMKVGTRLTLMMLLCLAPAALGFTLVTARTAANIFSQELKEETRIAQRGLNAALTADVEQGEWDEVRYILSEMGSEDLIAALLDDRGKLRFALPSFPIEPPPLEWIVRQIKVSGSAEFMRHSGGRLWFCRIELLGGGGQGYLLIAQDWTALRHGRYQRIATSLAAVAGFLLIVAIVIPLVSQRYVAQPLTELCRRVSRFSASGQDRLGDNEVTLISHEFGRVDQELANARRRLLEESERKVQLERRLLQTDKLATIGTLASGFAHEIGTPLGIIRGQTELLASRMADRKFADGLQIILSQIDRISSMVRMLLDLGRRRESIRTPVDVRTIIESTIRLLETEASRRRVKMAADLGSVPLVVNGDPDQLQQVFVNLEINALDAMGALGGHLRISSVHNLPPRKIGLCFKDTGPGVPEQLKGRIFDPFFTTKDPGKGTGMGLAVSQSIVVDHDGELKLEPSSQGANFVVVLPAYQAAELKRTA